MGTNNSKERTLSRQRSSISEVQMSVRGGYTAPSAFALLRRWYASWRSKTHGKFSKSRWYTTKLLATGMLGRRRWLERVFMMLVRSRGWELTLSYFSNHLIINAHTVHTARSFLVISERMASTRRLYILFTNGLGWFLQGMSIRPDAVATYNRHVDLQRD